MLQSSSLQSLGPFRAASWANSHVGSYIQISTIMERAVGAAYAPEHLPLGQSRSADPLLNLKRNAYSMQLMV